MFRLLPLGGLLETANHKSTRSALIVVHLTVFLDLLCFSIILPLLPLYALELSASGFEVGGLLACYAGAQLIGAPVLGRLSDKYGRRPILIAALIGTSLSMVATGFATTLPTLFAARTVAGIFGGSISAAQAYIADVTREEDRARAMGLLGASIGMGFVAGPALGAFLDPWGFGVASFCAGGIAGANALFAMRVLREPHRERGARQGPPRRQWSAMLGLGAIGRLLWAGFGMTLAFVAVETAFPLLGDHLWDLKGRDLGMVFAYVGVVVVITQGGLVGPLERRLGRRLCGLVGAVGMAIGLAVMGLGVSLGVWVSLAALGLISGSQGLLRPTLAAMLSMEADEAERGAVLGAGQGASALARALGPLLAGLLYDFQPSWPFLVAAGSAVAVALLLMGGSLDRHRRTTQ